MIDPVPLWLAAASGVAVALMLPLGPGLVGGRAARAVNRTPAIVLVAGVAAAATAAALTGAPILWGWIAAALVVGVGVATLVTRARRAACTRRGAGQVLTACEALVADLEAGAPPEQALVDAVAACPALASVAEAAALGADVPASLRVAASEPGHGDLRLIAAAWTVAHRSGGGLAAALRLTSRGLRARQATRSVVTAELSSARATGRLMAVLPVFTWLVGAGAGANPVWFLLGTPVGVTCLVVGLGLAFIGVGWIDGLAQRVERDL